MFSKLAEVNVTSLTFIVENVIYQQDGWCVVVTSAKQKVVGNFVPRLGACFSGVGKWVEAKYGRQFELESVAPARLVRGADIARYLGYQVEGIGPGTVESLVEEIGDDLERCLDENDHEKLADAIGPKKADRILAKWPQLKAAADKITPLLNLGLTEGMAERLVNAYGDGAYDVVRDNPYALIAEVDGIAFATADRIARKVGVSPMAPKRLKAALACGIRDATSSGSLGVPRADLLKRAYALVNPATLTEDIEEVPMQALEEVLYVMLTAGRSACDFSASLEELHDEKGEPAIWASNLLRAESRLVNALKRCAAPPKTHLIPMVPSFAAAEKMKLAPEQLSAVEAGLLYPVSVITGGPGCGKSATLKVLLSALDSSKDKGVLTAPTGKAAKRITESTGRPAQTMHSVLGIIKGQPPRFNAANPLPFEYMVIDEASMVDVELMSMALAALRPTARVIIVGDVDQLASVGPGQVLRDIIRSNTVPVTRLTKVFRQGDGSGIIDAAAQIRSGATPHTTADEQFVHVDTEVPHEAILDQIKSLLAAGVNPDDIQVLAPFHKGKAGCTALNLVIQDLLNPLPAGHNPKQVLRRETGDIRIGDRVIQNKNDKENGLVNGDIGWIVDINTATGGVSLLLADRSTPILLDKKSTQHLKLAYAITVHKSQGAEAPVVLIALEPSSAFMLKRNLVYTAVTRASKKAMVFGPGRTLHVAIRQGEPAEGSRRTLLASKLQAKFGVLSTVPKTAAMDSLLLDVPF